MNHLLHGNESCWQLSWLVYYWYVIVWTMDLVQPLPVVVYCEDMVLYQDKPQNCPRFPPISEPQARILATL